LWRFHSSACAIESEELEKDYRHTLASIHDKCIAVQRRKAFAQLVKLLYIIRHGFDANVDLRLPGVPAAILVLAAIFCNERRDHVGAVSQTSVNGDFHVLELLSNILDVAAIAEEGLRYALFHLLQEGLEDKLVRFGAGPDMQLFVVLHEVVVVFASAKSGLHLADKGKAVFEFRENRCMILCVVVLIEPRMVAVDVVCNDRLIVFRVHPEDDLISPESSEAPTFALAQFDNHLGIGTDSLPVFMLVGVVSLRLFTEWIEPLEDCIELVHDLLG
jgi:hypothetical protein